METTNKEGFEQVLRKNGGLLEHVVDMTKVNSIIQPEYYEIDFSKVASFNELILVLSSLKAGITLYPDEYDRSLIKTFLKKV